MKHLAYTMLTSGVRSHLMWNFWGTAFHFVFKESALCMIEICISFGLLQIFHLRMYADDADANDLNWNCLYTIEAH